MSKLTKSDILKNQKHCGSWHDGSCCCNCKNLLELKKHPWNKSFGKGKVIESCGWVCIGNLELEEDDKSRSGTYMDRNHSMCELYSPDSTRLEYLKLIKTSKQFGI